MKWGVLGTANIATRSVMPAIKQVQGDVLVAVASRTQEKAREVADAFGIDSHGSYDALLERSDIDAVYIPLPNSMHFEWALKALNAGKHVLIEKSAFVTLDEAEKAVALARSKRLAIVENFQFQHHGQHRTVKKMLEDGAIGEIRNFRASFGFPPFGGSQNIRYDRALGGGALLDAGAYTLKATSFILGQHCEVRAAHLAYNAEFGVDWFGAALLTDEDRKVAAQLAWGFDNFYQCNYEIWGAAGKITATRAYTAKPDFKPSIILELPSGVQHISLDADDHFAGMLNYFNRLVSSGLFAEELRDIVVQARALERVKQLGNWRY